MRYSFEVGDFESHSVTVELSPFGREVYRVDGEVVLKGWYFGVRGRRMLSVGRDEVHAVEFVYDAVPSWKELVAPGGWKAEVYVDGELYVEDLTREWRRRVRMLDHIANVVLLAFVGFALAGGVALLIWWWLWLA